MKKHERSDLLKTIGSILFIIALPLILALVVKRFFGGEVDAVILITILFFETVICSLYRFTKGGRYIWGLCKKDADNEQQYTNDKMDLAVHTAVYKNTFYDKPLKFTAEQRKAYDKAYSKMYRALASLGAKSVKPSDNYTNEEIYTLWFNRKSAVAFDIVSNGETELTAYISIEDGEPVIPMDVANELRPFKRGETVVPVVKKRKINKEAIRKQRRNHRLATERKKEQKEKNIAAANRRRALKKRQPPNYEYFAKEWVSQNIGYINKIIAGATNYGEKYADAFIAIDKLPAEMVTKQLIVKKLKDDGVICRYSIEDDGISIRAKTRYA